MSRSIFQPGGNIIQMPPVYTGTGIKSLAEKCPASKGTPAVDFTDAFITEIRACVDRFFAFAAHPGGFACFRVPATAGIHLVINGTFITWIHIVNFIQYLKLYFN
jgi:hypothetical protein